MIWLCMVLGIVVLLLGMFVILQTLNIREITKIVWDLDPNQLIRDANASSGQGDDDDDDEVTPALEPPKKKSSLDLYIDSIGGERKALEHVLKNYEHLEADFKKLATGYEDKQRRVKDLERFLVCSNVKRKKFQKAFRKARGAHMEQAFRFTELSKEMAEVSRVYDGVVEAVIDGKPIHVTLPHRVVWADSAPPTNMPPIPGVLSQRLL